MTRAPSRNVLLAPYTTLQVGGRASHWLDVGRLNDLRQALARARDEGLKVWLLGGGSNVLIADGGLAGLVLRVRFRQRSVAHVEAEQPADGDVLLNVGAGHVWDDLVAYTVERGWAGLECLAGIPGNVGAAPLQNVGAYGQEVSHTIEQVQLIERETGDRIEMTNEQCQFAYRDSLFKHKAADRYIVWSVRFRLRPAGAPLVAYPELQRALADVAEPSLAQVRDTVIALRRRKSMVLDPADPNFRSAGSFFVNPIVEPEQFTDIERLAAATLQAGETMPRYPAGGERIKLPAAWLIERAGMTKGYGDGPVGLSTNHTLAVVNRGSARANDVVRFAAHVRRRVFDRFGVALDHEPRLLGFQRDEIASLTDPLTG